MGLAYRGPSCGGVVARNIINCIWDSSCQSWAYLLGGIVVLSRMVMLRIQDSLTHASTTTDCIELGKESCGVESSFFWSGIILVIHSWARLPEDDWDWQVLGDSLKTFDVLWGVLYISVSGIVYTRGPLGRV